ncbi:centrosomal protein of 192 kDa-like isoform X2 [Montipora capricornis]|uniref:centrosomal protein of 192 kDa-like isoform X2 n=1 Tax=Montipora capricornis TaxID=246305 RepID=UPI0035F1B7A3
MAMDLDFSQESFAFSDIAPPSHVSGLESFSDFDASECSEVSFADVVSNQDPNGKEEVAFDGRVGTQAARHQKSSGDERSSLGLQGLNANNISEFLEAIHNAESLGIVSSSCGKSLDEDESSLGILQLDNLPDFDDNLSSQALKPATQPLERTLIGNDEEEEDEIVINRLVLDDDLEGEDISFTGEFANAIDSTPLATCNRNVMLQFEEKRPDTGQDPDAFFSSNQKEANVATDEAINEESIRDSYGQEEMDMMLQGRSGSGDGGELIDRVSLTSSISFIQSQTFPESILSQSFSSRGLGSGMDSCSESDGQEGSEDNTVSMLHAPGDGSNGRPGLEGGNSDAEDVPTVSGLPIDASNRLEAQGLELRQSAEGVDVLPDVPGDGGGGGDGSSGNNSDTDDGGPAGAAYASSSASILPVSSFLPTHASYGLSSHPPASDSGLVLPVSDGLITGRGCPVGDAAAGRSPVLIPSPELLGEHQASNSSTYPLQIQASSTPMVTQHNRVHVPDETSALESCYLMAHSHSSGSPTSSNAPRPSWVDDSTFHLSQVKQNRPSTALNEAESLKFDPLTADSLHAGLKNRDKVMTFFSSDTPFDTPTTQQSNQQRLGSWLGERSAPLHTFSNDNADFSSKFSNSAFLNGSEVIDDSQLWKSTPRDEEDPAMRATPGILFQGHARPSTVTGQVAGSKEFNPGVTERSHDENQSTTLASKASSGSGTGSQNITETAQDKTLTPKGLARDISSHSWDGNRSSQFLWPVGGDRQDPFGNEGAREDSAIWSVQNRPAEEPSWPFRSDALPGDDPFGGDHQVQMSWHSADNEFEPQGNALAIIDADEEIFNKEHELEMPSQADLNDVTRLHDWTIPDNQYVARPSLLRVVGINDPNNVGEVRISFGAFLAAGSEELGSLSRLSPDRPRPHFGNDKPILTPPPQLVVRPIGEPKTPFDPLPQDNKSSEDTLQRTSADGSMKGEDQTMHLPANDISQKADLQDQLKRHDITGEARNLGHSKSELPNMLSFEIQKSKLDEQFKSDVEIKSRSRSASQNSSQSNSSTGSVKSVITKNDRQTRQSGKTTAGQNQCKAKERKHSHGKEKQESQNMSRKPFEISRQSSESLQQFEEFYKHPGRIRSLRRSSFGDSSSMSLEKMTQFIAQAINEDPNEIRKKLTAVEKNKSKVKNKQRQPTSPEIKSASSEPRTSEFYPLASSSPQAKSSPERMTFTHVSIENRNITDSPKMLSSYTMENSVFQSEESRSMESLSLKELDADVLTPKRESLSEAGHFVHIIPQFGDTYTVRGTKKAEQQQHVPVIDPRKHRTQEIEQRLDNSFSENAESPDYDGKFSHLTLTEQPHSLTQEMSHSHSSSPRQRFQTSDSAVGSMSTSSSHDISNSRHSWPDVTVGHVEKPKALPLLDRGQEKTSQGGSTTVSNIPVTGATPIDNLIGMASMGNLSQGAPSSLLLHGHQTGHFVKQDFSLGNPPLSFSRGTAPFVNSSTVSPLYPTNNIHGPIGAPSMTGPILPGNGLTVQNANLSHMPPTVYNPPVVHHGLAGYPTQGLGPMNTFQSHVPFVQTVSASLGPKPSSLTPTYVQSLNVDIPRKIANPQVPLNLQSSSSMLPASFTHTGAPASIPYQLTPPQQMTTGLLQVKPEYSHGATLPQSAQVIIPGEIKFPPYCCVEVLTETVIPLHNSSSRWMHCEIRSILSTSNGVQVPSSASAFSFQPKAIIAPHTTENVRISIEPHEAGTFTSQLQVYSFPVVSEVQPITHSLGPVLSLEVVAEEPRIEVLLEDENTISFGEVSWGSKQCKPIHLINRGRAQVPIRIIISANSSALHCFGFAEADYSPKTDVVRSPAPAGAKGAALTIHTLSLKGRKDEITHTEPTVVLLLFQSPKVGLNSASSTGPPEEYVARLDVEIDSARQGPTICSVALKAIEGTVRLHTPHKLQVLTLKSSVGKSTSCVIPVKNAGNITARVKVKIEGDSQQFYVKPSQMKLRPEEESEVQVTYQPKEANKNVESLVVLSVPNGPTYELVVKGSALPKEDDRFTLLSSKPVLCWSGVALGWSQQQKVVLKTSSTSPVKLQLLVEGNHSDFQIQPTFSSHGRSPEHHQATLEPKKELPVHVSFTPSSIGLISSSLVIKSMAGKTNSKIPLYGCGGTSQLVLVDIRQLSEGYVTNIGEVSLGKRNSVKVVVRNSGTRAAFVKAVCYSDIHLLQQYPPTHLSVHPNSFILSERTSKTLLVEFQPLEKDAIKCRTAVNSVAVIAMYTGDEFMRRQYKRNFLQNPQHILSEVKENSPLAGIDFTTTFQDEDKLIEDVKYPKVASWDSFFQSCVSRVLLTLVGSPPSSSPVNKQDPNISVDTVPVSHKPNSKPDLLTSLANGDVAEKTWEVIPDFLTLTSCKSKLEKIGKGSDHLRIINFSERSVGFEFTWPAHSIVITPERGEIPARSQARVLVSAKPNSSNAFTHLPWAGTIYLKCDGIQQSIRVQIREEQVLESSPLQSSENTFHSLPSATSGTTPLPSNHTPPLRIKNKDIIFEETQIGTVSTSEISLTNTSPSEMTWNLSSVAPAYVKIDETGNICRTTYNAFSVLKHSGSLQPQATEQVLVKFQPRDVGVYEQSWDLMASSIFSRSKQRIFLHGQAAELSEDLEDANQYSEDKNTAPKSKKVTIKEPLRSPKEGKKGLYVAEKVVQFPSTSIGKRSEMKVKICNGSAENQYLARIASPKKPFSVNNTKFTVRAGRFVRLPVIFMPTEPGRSFEATLVVTADPETILSVKLQGSSSD